MILITGATGQLARMTINKLLEKIPANQIVAAVRSIEKAEDLKDLGVKVRIADYDVPEQWPAALEGVNKVYLISSPDTGTRVAKHRAVIEGVRKTKSVKLIAYTSILRADSCTVPYAVEDRETESLIRELEIRHVFLRHSWYIENYTIQTGQAMQHGGLYGCAKSGRISGASRLDYAHAAAAVLTTEENLKEIYELGGDESFSLAEFASEITKQTNLPVAYIDVEEKIYQSILVESGLPESIAEILAAADTGAANGQVYTESKDLSELLERPTTPMVSVLDKHLKELK